MERLIVFCFFISNFTILNSQNIGYHYYPLSVGNVWVYNMAFSSGPPPYKIRHSVTTSISVNNHRYYYIDNKYRRADSINGNLYQYFSGSGCPWSINERMIDSLASRLNDSAKRECGGFINRCIDTNIRVRFGISMRTKHFAYYSTATGGVVYAKDFGVISAYGGSGQNLWGQELLGCVINGVLYGDTSMVTGINQISSEIPNQFSLSQNYPNPFNPSSKVKFQMSKLAEAKLIVFDILGREVEILVNEQLNAGTYEVDFDGTNYPSGVYYYKLSAGDYTETKKMVLIK